MAVTLERIYDFLIKGVQQDFDSADDRKNFKKACRRYRVCGNDLYRLDQTKCDETLTRRVIMDKDERRRLIASAHEGSGSSQTSAAMAGHFGVNKTSYTLHQNYYWRTMTEDLRNYIRQCHVCQLVNAPTKYPRPTLHPVSVPRRPASQWGIDITSMPPSPSGAKCIVVAVCYTSKWPEARAVTDKTAHTVANFIWEDIICRHGCAEVVINDQGRELQ